MEEDIGMVGLYGMGGVGKTTLLTEINNKFLNATNKFDFVIWAVSSKNVRIEDMQDEIAEKIGLSRSPNWKEKHSSAVKAENIFNFLTKKKFVLLLDDLWNQVELKHIGIPTPNEQNKSKVVFTTRSEQVCGEMGVQRSIKVEPLSNEEAWKLFQNMVGAAALDADCDIPPIAREVARECAGLPLALVTVGRSMACKKTPQEWQHALEILRKSAADFRGMEDKIFSTLKFSYDNLPNEKVKSCLLYLTLFPEDFEIGKEELIQIWACENFWDDGDNGQIDDAMNEGYDIIGTLVHACLLEDEGEEVKMHDVIRDMCLWIACDVEKQNENYFVKAGSRLTKAPDMRKLTEVRRISLMRNYIEQLSEVPETPRLLTFFLRDNHKLNMINDGFFQHMKALTVLDLSRTKLKVLPAGISELVSLQYLDISRTMIAELPWELTNLKKLKFFNLESTVGLTLIPKQMIASFQLLQVLKAKDCRFVVDTSKLEELECLEDLKWLSIKITRHLILLHRLLSSDKLSSCIRYIEIKYLISSRSQLSKKDEDAPAGTSSELVETERKPGEDLHKSLGKKCFTSLLRVDIFKSHGFRDLTWLTLAPNLKKLTVWSCDDLEEVISYRKLDVEGDEYENLNLFARLQVLELQNLPRLHSICGKPLFFWCLKKIRIYGCPELKKLPLNCNSAKRNNLVVQGSKDWWDKLQWEDDSTPANIVWEDYCIPSYYAPYYASYIRDDERGCAVM